MNNTLNRLNTFKSSLLFVASISLLLVTQVACSDTSKPMESQTKIVENGEPYSQLKQEIKTAEISADRDPHKDAYMASYLLRKNANGDIKQLKQAYLWNVVGDKEKGIMTAPNPSIAGFALYTMHKNGELKQVDPKLDVVWGDRRKVIKHLSQLKLPDLLTDVRRELAKTDMPIFSVYRFEELRSSEGHLMELYSDGRVKLRNDGTWVGALQIKSTPQAVKNFMDDLKKLGLYNWGQPNNDWFGATMCEYNCYSSILRLTTRDGGNVNRIFFRGMYENFNDKPNTSETYLARHENLVRMAKVRSLVEQYFPTSEFRCKNNVMKDRIEGFVETCIQRETAWKNLAKEEK